MNPIDQIRKALEDHFAHNEKSGIHLHTAMVSADALQALLASHDAAVQRAAEMQERCAQVCEARVMGDNNREDAEARACAAAIRAIKE